MERTEMDDIIGHGEIENYQSVHGRLEWKPINQEQEEMIKTNSLKSKLEAGDLVYSKTYGVGFIHDIEPNDCWYPIEVKFEQKIWLFGKMETKYRMFL